MYNICLVKEEKTNGMSKMEHNKLLEICLGGNLKMNKKEENKILNTILSKIKLLEKSNNQYLVERACNKYVTLNREKRKAEEEIKKLENQLEKAKKQLK